MKFTKRLFGSSWKPVWIKVIYLHSGHIKRRNLCGNVIPKVSLTTSPKIVMFARGHNFCQKKSLDHQGFLEKMTKFQVCQNHFKKASLSMWTMVIHKRGRI